MGRHRRSAAGRAEGAAQPGGSGARDHDPQASYTGDVPLRGTAPYLNPEAYAEARARSDAYLFGTDDPAGTTVAFSSGGLPPEGPGTPEGPEAAAGGGRRPGFRRRRKKAGSVPVRAGLLGVSAAVALGAVAVTTGAVPGLDGLRIGQGPGGSDKVQAADSPGSTPSEQGGTSGSVAGDEESAGSGTGSPASSSSPSASASASKTPSASASPAPEKTTAEPKKPAATAGGKTESTPSRTATEEPQESEAAADRSVTVSQATAAEAEVVRLVNEERAKVGCTPVAASSGLTELAEDFSEAMAAQDFFDHTDPSGATPWDRAEAAGITNLGGENIARGQADAAAVMDAWMNSEGHRANILNCDFRTLGVGVHFASGGPWWTQDFGY
ncbi:CAP domain-containing protein [Streptomyces sp. ISL-12]|uniref:CAP domain-containing protein n=1 Tax=Streptomyces sp. ISL-12 TaxID=2819177 RepID=UPI001BEC92C8|nr:CAP domain-containing protein [Streptomyces sp. ISL-12]MBT2409208.1 CAP domain-containing protein [Streptomyces sp. ISL-12]